MSNLTGDVFGRTNILAHTAKDSPHALLVPSNERPTCRFYVVVSGNANVNCETLPPWCCLWEPAGEQTASIQASSQGAEIITLQFPSAALLPVMPVQDS